MTYSFLYLKDSRQVTAVVHKLKGTNSSRDITNWQKQPPPRKIFLATALGAYAQHLLGEDVVLSRVRLQKRFKVLCPSEKGTFATYWACRTTSPVAGLGLDPADGGSSPVPVSSRAAADS